MQLYLYWGFVSSTSSFGYNCQSLSICKFSIHKQLICHPQFINNLWPNNFFTIKCSEYFLWNHIVEFSRVIFEIMYLSRRLDQFLSKSKKKIHGVLKFMFSKKATKIDKIFTVDLTVTTYCQIDGKDFVNFCGLLRKHEL